MDRRGKGDGGEEGVRYKAVEGKRWRCNTVTKFEHCAQIDKQTLSNLVVNLSMR